MRVRFNKAEVRKAVASAAEKLSWLGAGAIGVFGLTAENNKALAFILMVAVWVVGQAVSIFMLAIEDEDTS